MISRLLLILLISASLFITESCFLTPDEDPMYALGIVNYSGLELDIYVTTNKDQVPYEFVETIPVDFSGQILARSFNFNQFYWGEARTADGTVYSSNGWFEDGSDVDVHWWYIN